VVLTAVATVTTVDTVTVVCYSVGGFEFFYLFIFDEFLKNHRKIIK